MLPGLGPIHLNRLLSRFGCPRRIAFDLDPRAFNELDRIGPRKSEEIREARRDLAGRVALELRRCRRAGVRPVALPDPEYPPEFRELPDPPVLIYLRGRLTTDAVRVAVVGSRDCTAYGRRIGAGLGSGLAARGIEIVSGGARGVDSAAHRGALEVDGRTVAALGSGLLQPYPPENSELFEKIAGSGALISEFALDVPPRAGHFPQRNRLISALSLAVVVVEAAARSGTLSTASHALDQGREVLAVPGPVSSARSVGCHKLIRQGAQLVQNVEDIVRELRLPAGGPETTAGVAGLEPNLTGLTDDERSVLSMLDEIEPVQLDELADSAPFGVARLQAALFGLELRGAVDQTPGRYYLLRPRREE